MIRSNSAVVKNNDRIILFATGALISQTVLDTLAGKNLKPFAIVLPTYPPASFNNLPGVIIGDNTDSDVFVDKARKLLIPVLYAPEELQQSLRMKIFELHPDYILVACWPYLISPEITELAGKAALNIHPSLLPKYRGANPVSDQLSHREAELGVTLHLLSQEFDQGDILSQADLFFPSGLPEKETLEIKAAEAGAGLFIDAMEDYADPGWRPVKQSDISGL